jgi:F0F1-type ATP synthase epsilon subunit
MAEVPTKLVVDCSTGKTEIIALTAAELAERDQMAAKAAEEAAVKEAAEQAAAATKAAAEAKLTALGLTPEEIAALGK